MLVLLTYKGLEVNEFGQKLKNARKKQKLSQQALADLLNVSRVAITNYELGRNNPSFENVEKLSKILKTELTSSNNSIEVNFIPLIGKSSCGIPKDFDLNGYELIPIASNKYKRGMYAVTADGHSMSPKIKHGYTVICDPNQIIDNGKIVHYTLGNGESGIKKYKMNDSGTIISLIPINPDYEVITIHCDDNIDLRMSRVVGSTDNDY